MLVMITIDVSSFTLFEHAHRGRLQLLLAPFLINDGTIFIRALNLDSLKDGRIYCVLLWGIITRHHFVLQSLNS